MQVLHGHPNAPVCMAGRRHGARRTAAQVAQVGELSVGNGGQGAADGLAAHGRGRRGLEPPAGSGWPAAARLPRLRRRPRVPGSPPPPRASQAARPSPLTDTRSRGRSFPTRPTPAAAFPEPQRTPCFWRPGSLRGGAPRRGGASSRRPEPPKRVPPGETRRPSSSLPNLPGDVTADTGAGRGAGRERGPGQWPCRLAPVSA